MPVQHWSNPPPACRPCQVAMRPLGDIYHDGLQRISSIEGRHQFPRGPSFPPACAETSFHRGRGCSSPLGRPWEGEGASFPPRRPRGSRAEPTCYTAARKGPFHGPAARRTPFTTWLGTIRPNSRAPYAPSNRRTFEFSCYYVFAPRRRAGHRSPLLSADCWAPSSPTP